jgi:hypothetical protein
MRTGLLWLALCFPIFAQPGAELTGVVLDPSGLPAGGAAIAAQQQATGARFATVTNLRGEYRLLGMPAGEYAVTVEAAGFRSLRRTGVVLRSSDRRTLDLQLELAGATATAIEVRGDAPLLETARGQVSYSVDHAKIESMPLDGRNFVPLVALSPGVALPSGGLLPRINGSRPRTNEYLYDGISVLQPEPGQVAYYPILDAIEEFRLNISSYSPEYGRSNGGTVMVTTRSGANTLHGSLWEYFRNEALNARNLFAPAGPKPEFRRNQFGATAGGPIQRNRAFYFVDWQSSRLRTGITRISTVPTEAQRVPTGAYDPAGLAVLQRYPLPNRSGAANNYARTGVEPDDQDQFDTRVDRYFGGRHRTFARYSFMRDDDTPVTPLPDGSGAITSGLTGSAHTRADGLVAEHDWSPRANWLNVARFGYSRRSLQQSSVDPALPTYLVAGYQQIGATAGANVRQTTSITEFTDTATVARGAHTLKFGVDIRREALDVLAPANPAGAYTFNAAATGNSLTALMIGHVAQYTIDIQPETLQPRAHIAEFFVTDEWRLSRRLTVNLGTRYTLNFPSTEKHDRGAVFNLNTQVLDFPHTARELERADFGPRVGLAWRVGDSAVVRAGYGLMWFEQSGITTPFTLPQFPFVQTVGQIAPNNSTPAFFLSAGPTVKPAPIGPDAGLGQGVFGADRNNGSGYSQQWNLTLQRTIRRDWNLEVGYLGSKNTRLGVPDVDLNQVRVEDLAAGRIVRLFPRFTAVALFRNNVGQSTYHALQAKAEKRMGHGITVTAAYTHSKLIDDASSVFSNTIFTGPLVNTGVADAFNRHLEKDLSNGDIPNVFSAGWVWQLPHGFTIAGLMRLQSGIPVTVSQATNFNASYGFGVQRPNRLRDPNGFDGRTVQRWFDTTAFTQAPVFTIGNSSRNPVRGPGLQSADLMVGKTFRLTDRAGVELRAEAFNVSNTPPLGDPNGSFGSAAFGSITTAGNPRVFELVARLRF